MRGLHRNVRLYFVATALLGFSIDGGIYSVVFNLYLVRLGYGPEFIGVVNSVGLLVFALSACLRGARGPGGLSSMVIAGMALIIVGGALLPLAQTIAPLAPGGWLITSYTLVFLGLAVFSSMPCPF